MPTIIALRAEDVTDSALIDLSTRYPYDDEVSHYFWLSFSDDPGDRLNGRSGCVAIINCEILLWVAEQATE